MYWLSRKKPGIDQGRIAPDIIGLASRDEERLEWGKAQGVDKYIGNWVFTRLKDSDLLEKKAKMPHFPLTEEEMAAATMALLSDTGEDIPSQYVVSASNQENYPDLPGEFGKIVDKYRCRSCHVVYGKGSWISMHPLDGEGSEVRKGVASRVLQPALQPETYTKRENGKPQNER